ncbi:MAG: hypothetical protein J4203_07535 [Candidatus Diapherotrites archaeon]|uniref:KaiC domain-containing protein n=1 Tax=Candidatus Iainarchaeum sp. TaxID=3101447 RepID=A0A8T4L8U3_9ARCH|nr:hypothetical protein [Candidatus Diapherotrites archaeon]
MDEESKLEEKLSKWRKSRVISFGDDEEAPGEAAEEDILRLKPKEVSRAPIETLPTRVSSFDKLIKDGGLERGSTTLVTGGCGTGKTTFCLQSIYHGALAGEKGIFISFEEEPHKVKKHMVKNYGWDFDALERQGMVAIVKFDPTKIARSVEGRLAEKTGSLRIKFRKMELPFVPDRIAIDSLSALSIGFEAEENYRKYLRELFETLEYNNSVNLVIGETEQDPQLYSRTGVEEFLADGVVVLYNMKTDKRRENALELLKLRSCAHEKRMVAYRLGNKGFDISYTGGNY